jgi:hypothetical protein
MGQGRVWNITDDSRTEVPPHNRMVLGKTIKPGRSVLVDEDRLRMASKVQKEVTMGYLHVGNQLPKSYSAQKQPPRAVADARRVDESGRVVAEQAPSVLRGHGQVPTEIRTVSPEPAPESTPAPSIEASLQDQVTGEDEFGYRKKKGRRE